MLKIVAQLKWICPIIFIVLSGCSFSNNDSPTSSSTDDSIVKLQSPDDGTKSVSIGGASLQWTTTAQAGTIFQIFIEPTTGKDVVPTSTSWNTTPTGTGTTATNYSTGTLSYLTWYAWRVRALMPSGSWTDSKVRYFQTEDVPAIATNIIKVYDFESHINVDHDIPILFQMTDASGNGVTGLSLTDFDVMEDNEPLRESNLKLVHAPAANISLPVSILIDNSTSITGTSNLARMKADAASIVNALKTPAPFTSYFYVYEFSESLIPRGGTVPTALQSTQAVSEINAIQAGVQSTDFNGAVAEVARSMTNSFTVQNIVQQVMIVLSDGDDTAGKSTLYQATNAVYGKRVYTIGYAGDLREDVLKTIGVSGYYNSSFGNVTPFLNNIRTYFNNYAQSFYILTVTSPKRGFKNHTISIRMKGSVDQVNVTYPGW